MNAAIRPARGDEYDAVARVWFDSFDSTGCRRDYDVPYESLRARIPQEIKNGWQLYVTDMDGEVAAMLAIKPAENYLDQLFVAPAFQGKGIGSQLLKFTRTKMPDEIWLRTDANNTNAIAWYEREGFVREKTEKHPSTPRMMAYYRWKRSA